MKWMKVYFITQEDMGEYVELHPKIPKHRMSAEDKYINRICVCSSIYSCIVAIGGIKHLKLNKPIYVYSANINIDNIEQPNTDMVPDSIFTGELWVMRPQEFKRLEEGYIIELLESFTWTEKGDSLFTRGAGLYSCKLIGYDPLLVNEIYSIYGTIQGFTFLDSL